MDFCCTTAYSGVALKNSERRNFPYWAELQAVYPFEGGRNYLKQKYIWTLRQLPMAELVVQNLEGATLGNQRQKSLGKKHVDRSIRLLLWAAGFGGCWGLSHPLYA